MNNKRRQASISFMACIYQYWLYFFYLLCMHPHTSALVDFDVAPPPESVLVFEGPGEQCVNITIRMDQILESEEDFFVVLFTQ